MTNNEQVVVKVEGIGADSVQTYTINTDELGADGSVTVGEGDQAVTITVLDGEQGVSGTIGASDGMKTVTVTSAGNVGAIHAVGGQLGAPGPDPSTLMTIGGIATAVGLLLTIIAASLISKAMKANKGAETKSAAPVSFSPTASSGTDPQVIAAITAALMAYQGETGGKGQLVVRSVRRVGSASGWANAGRQAQINY